MVFYLGGSDYPATCNTDVFQEFGLILKVYCCWPGFLRVLAETTGFAVENVVLAVNNHI